MEVKFATGVTPDMYQSGQRLYDAGQQLIGRLRNSPLQLTNELFQKIGDGEIFRTVITNIQNVHESFVTTLKFVCKKGDGADWAIYCHTPNNSDVWIAMYGDKVRGEETIRSICPCDDETFELYRQ